MRYILSANFVYLRFKDYTINDGYLINGISQQKSAFVLFSDGVLVNALQVSTIYIPTQ